MTDAFDSIDSQEESDRKRAERARVMAEMEKSDLIWLMQSKRGRRIAYRILSEAGVFRTSFNTNALQMAFNEGNRNYGLKLLTKVMTHCADQYAQTMTENSDND